jgi:hypothetical protein
VIIHQRERSHPLALSQPDQLLATMGDWLIMHGVPRDSMQDLKESAMPCERTSTLSSPMRSRGRRAAADRPIRVRVWWTPGHSPGHICFLERQQRFILTGVACCRRSLNVSPYPQQQGNLLGDYIASLERLEISM